MFVKNGPFSYMATWKLVTTVITANKFLNAFQVPFVVTNIL